MSDDNLNQRPITGDVPRGDLAGFFKYLKDDLISGLLVFLIALPLCLGIANASGYPALAGVFTAIIGAILTTFISNSELTIKGPAAGLIVITLGAIETFGGDGQVGGFTEVDMQAYRLALAVGVAAAVLQIICAVFRAGILGEFFPVSAVHGMLAAIGVIIIAKQIPVALGVSAKGEPLHLLASIPEFLHDANPAIAAIGLISLIVMFIWPAIRKRIPIVKPVPAPLVVVLLAIPMGMSFGLTHDHTYEISGRTYEISSQQHLVSMPSKVFGMFEYLTLPDFAALTSFNGWKWVFMFFIIGSLESLLSAKAVDILDPWKRKTSMDRDLLAVGVANLLCGFVGGLPMISEIVRSRANIDNGAKTRFADLWHGVFLLVCVALIPMVLHLIPMAALAAMLVYTGTRLAHPNEFMHVYKTGREQLFIFVVTMITTLATDLLIGVAAGIGTKLLIHVMNDVPVSSLFKTYLDVEQLGDEQVLIRAHQSAVFSNWIPFRRQLEDIGLVQRQNITLDLSDTALVDHHVMNNLQALQADFEQQGLYLNIIGLEAHKAFAEDRTAARKRGKPVARRVTVIAPAELQDQLQVAFVNLGAPGYTATVCSGAGRKLLAEGVANSPSIRLEVIALHRTAEAILRYVREDVHKRYPVTSYIETVEVDRMEDFAGGEASDSTSRELAATH